MKIDQKKMERKMNGKYRSGITEGERENGTGLCWGIMTENILNCQKKQNTDHRFTDLRSPVNPSGIKNNDS